MRRVLCPRAQNWQRALRDAFSLKRAVLTKNSIRMLSWISEQKLRQARQRPQGIMEIYGQGLSQCLAQFLSGRLKATPHNSARADPEKIWVLIKALFRRCTLCTSRKSDEIRAQIFQEMPQADCAVLP